MEKYQCENSAQLLGEMRATALELQSLLASDCVYRADELDSYTDLNPFSFSSDATNVTLPTEETNALQRENIDFSRNHGYIDLWRSESLTQYSMLRSAFNTFEFDLHIPADIILICQGIITALQRLLNSTKLVDISNISLAYKVLYEENELLRAKILSANEFSVENDYIQCPKTPKIISDLNRTDVFEVVEKMCDQAESERETIEKELQDTRYDMDRLRGNCFQSVYACPVYSVVFASF